MSAPPKMPPQGLYAFPLHVGIPDGQGGTYYATCPGMTLRDYFAAAAIPEAMRLVVNAPGVVVAGEEPDAAVARIAWEVADAMLRRRAGPPSDDHPNSTWATGGM